MSEFALPVKTREIYNHHMNSEAWNAFKYRADDIVIATFGKSGTTWMQQIVGQLIFGGKEDLEVWKLSPWVELRLMQKEALAWMEKVRHRRFVKTHLPVSAITFSPKAKYIYVGRDGRDAVWSLYNHYRSMKPDTILALNTMPGRLGPPLPPAPDTVLEFYRTWLKQDGAPFWPVWENIRSWWAIRGLPNVKFVHFNDLLADLPGQVRAIAAFLNIAIDEAVFPRIVEHCTFEYMKSHAESVTPMGGAPWEGGAAAFIHKGINGRWRGTLEPEDIAAYEAKAVQELGAECASWLAGGTLGPAPSA